MGGNKHDRLAIFSPVGPWKRLESLQALKERGRDQALASLGCLETNMIYRVEFSPVSEHQDLVFERLLLLLLLSLFPTLTCFIFCRWLLS